MLVRFLSLLVAVFVLVGARPANADEPRVPADSPLPKGAKIRLGVSRPILRTGPSVALLPPGCTSYLAPTITGGVRRYGLATGQPLDKDGVVGPGQVVVSADGKTAAVARAGALSLVEVVSGKQTDVTPADGDAFAGVPAASLSADGKVLAYCAQTPEGKSAVVVWDVGQARPLARAETFHAVPLSVLLSPDGKTLVSYPVPPPATAAEKKPAAVPADKEAARSAQVWDAAGGKGLFQARVTGMGGGILSAAFSADSALLALSAGEGHVDLWDVQAGKFRQTLLGRRGQGVRVAFAPDGNTVAAVGPDYRIQRWSIDGKSLGVSEQPANVLRAQITGLAFADNERVIAWLTAVDFAVAWDAPNTHVLTPAMDHVSAILSIGFPEDGKSVLTSGYDGKVLRWDRTTGELAETVALHRVRLPAEPTVGPVAKLSGDGTRGVWLRSPTEVFDIASGDHLFCVPPPSSPAADVGFGLSPDGLKLALLTPPVRRKRAGACVVWDLTTGQRVAEFEVPASTFSSTPTAVFSPSGTRLAVGITERRPGAGTTLAFTGFEVKTGKQLGHVEDAGVNGTVTMCAANDDLLVLASTTGQLWTVDYAAGKIGQTIERLAHRGEAAFTGPVVFSPDGKLFATGVVGEQYTTYGVRVYDWAHKKALHTYLGHTGPVTALRFSSDGRFLASGSRDTSVLLWDLAEVAGKE